MFLDKLILKNTKNYKLAVAIVSLLVAVLVGLVIWQAVLVSQIRNNITGNTADAQEIQRVVDEVNGVVEKLPDETPTLATVTDVSKLEGQEFFVNAKNDDKVLMFATARIAILYRESTHKIVNMGPIAITDESTEGTTQN